MATAKKTTSTSTAKTSRSKRADAAPSPSKAAVKKKPPASKKVGARKPTPRGDALVLLAQEHKAVKKHFKQYEKLVKADAGDSEKQALAGLICAMLKKHATIEEEIFYPAAREVLAEPDLLDEAEVEHASAKDLIAQIEAANPADSLYDARVHVLAEYIDHHVKEEEEEMFPKLRRTKLDLVVLGQALKQRNEALGERADAGPPGRTVQPDHP